MGIDVKGILTKVKKCAKWFLELCGWSWSDSEDGKLMPKFKFGPTLVGVLLLWGVFALNLVLLCFTKVLLVKSGFHVSFERVFASAANIFAGWAWPCGILIVIYLFKGNLNGLVNALGQIHNGPKDERPSPKGSDFGAEDFEEARVNVARGNESRISLVADGMNKGYGLKSDAPRKDPKTLVKDYLKDIILFKSYALKRLQRDNQILISRHVRLFNARDFDGAYRVRDTMYGIRVKWKPTREVIERELANIERFYCSLTDSQRGKFRAVLCISSGGIDVDSIVEIHERLKYTVPIEHHRYEFDPNDLKGLIQGM